MSQRKDPSFEQFESRSEENPKWIRRQKPSVTVKKDFPWLTIAAFLVAILIAAATFSAAFHTWPFTHLLTQVLGLLP